MFTYHNYDLLYFSPFTTYLRLFLLFTLVLLNCYMFVLVENHQDYLSFVLEIKHLSR